MRSRRRGALLALGILVASGSGAAALLARRAAIRARAPFWLEDRAADSWVTGLAFSADEKWLAAGYARGGFGVWSLADRAVLRLVPGSPSALKRAVNNAELTPLGQVAFTGDGRLVAETEDATIELHRLPGFEVTGVIRGKGAYYDGRGFAVHGSRVTRLAIERGPAIEDRGIVEVWDVTGDPACVTSFGEEPGQEMRTATRCSKLVFDRTGDRIVRACYVETVERRPGSETISARSAILVHDARTGARLGAFERDAEQAMAVSPASDTIAVETTQALGVELLAFDGTSRGKIVLPVAPGVPERQVNALAFSPDGRLLAIGVSGVDEEHSYPFRSRLVIWDIARAEPKAIIDARVVDPTRAPEGAANADDDVGEPGRWEAVTFSPSGESVAASFGRRVYVFRVDP